MSLKIHDDEAKPKYVILVMIVLDSNTRGWTNLTTIRKYTIYPLVSELGHFELETVSELGQFELETVIFWMVADEAKKFHKNHHFRF